MSNFYQKLCDAIGAASVREQEPMSAHTTFRAGGPARYFVTPEGEKELAAVLAACREAEKAYYILGNGSNLLVSDAGYPGVMILLGSQFTEVVCPEGEPGVYELGAGVLLSRAAREAQKDGMTGFEFAAGIPGTVGGAAVMNAGAYGGELKDVLESVRVMTPDGEVKELKRKNWIWVTATAVSRSADISFYRRGSVWRKVIRKRSGCGWMNWQPNGGKNSRWNIRVPEAPLSALRAISPEN